MATVPAFVRTVKTPTLPIDDDDCYERAYEPTERDWADYHAHLEAESSSRSTVHGPRSTDEDDDYFAPSPFACWIEATAAAIRSEGTDRARWLADRIDDLAVMATFLHARDGATFEDRMSVIESRGGAL